jgi:hypothetical protein
LVLHRSSEKSAISLRQTAYFLRLAHTIAPACTMQES